MLTSETIVSAVKRDISLRTKDLRKTGFIPAVIYGQGDESIVIQIEYQAFRKAFRETGTSTLLDIDFEGKKIPTLVHDIQYHPVSGEYVHLDLYKVQEGVPVTTHIDVIIEGLAPAVKNKAAVLVTPITALEIKCLPRNLFHDIKIDVSGLENYHDTIKVSDIELANNKDIEILTDMEASLVTVNPPKGGAKNEEDESAESNNAGGEEEKK